MCVLCLGLLHPDSACTMVARAVSKVQEVHRAIGKQLSVSDDLPRIKQRSGGSVLGTLAGTILTIALLGAVAAFAVHKLGFGDKVQALISQLVPGHGGRHGPMQAPLYDRLPGSG